MKIGFIIFYSSITAIYLYSGLATLYTYGFKNTDKTLTRYFISLCFLSGLYTLCTLSALIDNSSMYFLIAPFFGFLVWFFYIQLINYYLEIEPKISIISKYVCLFASSFYGVQILLSKFTNYEFFKELPLKTENIYFSQLGFSIESPIWDFILLGVSFSIILSTSLYYANYLFKKRKDESLLFIGVILSILSTINDGFFAKEVFKYAIPLAGVGFLIEVMRFFIFIQGQANKKIGQLEDEIIKVSTLAELGTLTVGISHDIKNPLTVIKSVETILRKKMGDTKELRLLKGSAEKLNQIVDTYLGLIYKGNFQAKKFDLYNLVEDTSEICRHKLNLANISLGSNIKKGQVELQQIYNPIILSLVNLVGNSCDAIIGLEDRWINIFHKKSDDMVILQVIDSGKGIPKEIQDKIFERQYSTKNRSENGGSGSGLGLYLVKNLLKEVQGDVFYKEVEGHTCFELHIPLMI